MSNQGPKPTAITPQQQQCLVDRLREGNFPKVACAACGVNKDTYTRWVRLGGGLPDHTSTQIVPAADAVEPYKSFAEAINRAMAEVEAEAVGHLIEAVRRAKDPRHILAFLGRRYPLRWGREGKVEFDAGSHGTVVITMPHNFRERLDPDTPTVSADLDHAPHDVRMMDLPESD